MQLIDNPLVSIVIPVYNGSNYLRDAIDSALAQTYPNIEVLVINDGSNDGGETEKIALSYGGRIRYFPKKNGGVASALNLGITEMKGEYFSWLSHDDRYYSRKIQVQIEALRKHSDPKTVVHGDYDLVEEPTGVVTHVCQSEIYSPEQLTRSVFPVLENVIHGCAMLIHRDHFERVGMFDLTLPTTQDYDLWFRILRHQQSLYINESLVAVRVHEAQGSRTLRHTNDFNLEQANLRVAFMKELTEDEMTAMYGSSYNFYHRMSCYFKGGAMPVAYEYANEQFQLAKVPSRLNEQLSEFKEHIRQLSAGRASRLYIFCAGDYGLRLSQELHNRLVVVDGFSDNNPDKWGCTFDNLTCISPSQLEAGKEDTLVLVATRTPDGIVQQLRERGYPYVHTKQQLDQILIQIPPVRHVE